MIVCLCRVKKCQSKNRPIIVCIIFAGDYILIQCLGFLIIDKNTFTLSIHIRKAGFGLDVSLGSSSFKPFSCLGLIGYNAIAVTKTYGKILHSKLFILNSGLFKPFNCFSRVLRNAVSRHIANAQTILGFGKSRIRCVIEQFDSSCLIHRDII